MEYKEGTGKYMKNALHIQQMALLGLLNSEKSSLLPYSGKFCLTFFFKFCSIHLVD